MSHDAPNTPPPLENPEKSDAATERQPVASSNANPPDPPRAETAAEQPAGAGGTERRPKIQIGGRRPAGGMPRRPVARDASDGTEELVATPTTRPSTPVAVPSTREPLSEDLEREMAAAFGGSQLDDLMTRTADVHLGELAPETRIRSIVMRVDKENVFFSLGGPNEGVAAVRQFAEPPTVGEQLDVVVKTFNADDGLYEVAVPGAAVDVSDWDDLVEGSVVEARVTGANTGGLECRVNALRGFIPTSQISQYRVENLADFIDQKLLCVVTEVNPRRKNLVLSHRAILDRNKEEERQKLLADLEVGQVREGVVRSLRDFGAFVDLGGVDGLIHVSQLSWERVQHPQEILQEGQKVRVRVEKIDPQTGKIGLSLRSLTEHPWLNVEQKFPNGSVHRGTVTRIAKFGAFVKLSAGVEGLIHISELAHHRVQRVHDILQEGQEIEVKVLSVDAENQRIGLSLKATQPEPSREEPEEEASDQAPARQPAVRRSQTPLRGGIERGSGGEPFGLRW